MPISLEHPSNAFSVIAVTPEGMTAVKTLSKFEFAMQREQVLQVIVVFML